MGAKERWSLHKYQELLSLTCQWAQSPAILPHRAGQNWCLVWGDVPLFPVNLSALVFPSLSVLVSGMWLTGHRLSRTGEKGRDNLQECAQSLLIGSVACVPCGRTAVLVMNWRPEYPLRRKSTAPVICLYVYTVFLVPVTWMWTRISSWMQFWAVYPRINQKLLILSVLLGEARRVALGFPNRIAMLLVHMLEEKRFSGLTRASNAPCHSNSEKSSS